MKFPQQPQQSHPTPTPSQPETPLPIAPTGTYTLLPYNLELVSPQAICQLTALPRSTTMTLIETPAGGYMKSSFLEQIDGGVKSISKIILWTNSQSQMAEEEGQEDGSGEEEWRKDGDEGDSFGDGELFPDVFGEKGMEHGSKIPLLGPSVLKKESSSSQKQGQQQKKSCNCKKTQCLKLYCDCFRQNRKCEGCSCIGCHNTQQYSQQRKNAALILTDRNPTAFMPKIQEQSKHHSKGCHCKKSNCMKKYCQCYQAGLKCGDNCKCQDCKNCQHEDKKLQKKGTRILPFNFRLKMEKGPSIIVPIGQPIDIYRNKAT